MHTTRTVMMAIITAFIVQSLPARFAHAQTGRLAWLEGRRIRIAQPIHFNTGKVTIATRSLPVLDAVARVMATHLEVRLVSVQGHTDSRGSGGYNQKLSKKRAQTVCDYLIRAGGVMADRLRAKGLGESRPIASNSTAAGRRKNSRIEFAVLALTGEPIPPLDQPRGAGAAAPGSASSVGLVRADMRGVIQLVKPIRFKGYSAVYDPTCLPVVDALAALLRARPELAKISIEAHTDVQAGTQEQRQKLTRDRADMVITLLVARGIARHRLLARGYGATLPIASNRVAEGRRMNNRIVVRTHTLTMAKPKP